MKKLALTAAVLAFPVATFAGGAGNADLLNYTRTSSSSRVLNFDPSVRAERVQPQVDAIGSTTTLGETSSLQTDTTVITEDVVETPTRTYVRRRTTTSGSVNEGSTYNRLQYSSDQELLTDREIEARKKLLRYRSLGY